MTFASEENLDTWKLSVLGSITVKIWRQFKILWLWECSSPVSNSRKVGWGLQMLDKESHGCVYQAATTQWLRTVGLLRHSCSWEDRRFLCHVTLWLKVFLKDSWTTMLNFRTALLCKMLRFTCPFLSPLLQLRSDLLLGLMTL